MNTWIASDTHFGHKRIIELANRPFASVEEMDAELIRRWNVKVAPNDLVFHLGDVFLCGAKRAAEIASQLNGRKILIRGNHDHFTDTKFRSLGFEPFPYYYYEGAFLSHYPQSVETMAVAIAEGAIDVNIHGHVHDDLSGTDEEVHSCVCVEHTNYEPVPFYHASMPPELRHVFRCSNLDCAAD